MPQTETFVRFPSPGLGYSGKDAVKIMRQSA